MIKKVTDNIDLSGVSSPLLPLIYCDFHFNSGDAEGVYLQYNEVDELTAVFSLKNGCVTFSKVRDADFSEALMFFSFLGVSDILSDCPLNGDFKAFSLLEATTRSEKTCDVGTLSEKSKLSEYQNIYKLLNEEVGNFSNWYGNFSRKINSGNALGVYKAIENSVVSTATATAIYNKNAVISGVFTNPLYRGKGYVTECVKALINLLHKKNVKNIYLWCEDDKIPFYEKTGFNVKGKIYLRKV
ncbi:MAG: GNAT family N-acetyltransferase [Clostridia bacterium]|nr:GNAT family N-acetyltransferase [Clostridia bacterium]